MELAVIHLFVVIINCGWFLSYVDCKTFSLNEAIEREKALSSTGEPIVAESAHIFEDSSRNSDRHKATEPRRKLYTPKDSLTPIHIRLREKLKKATEKLQLQRTKKPTLKLKNLFQKKSSTEPRKFVYKTRPLKKTPPSKKREIYKHGKVIPKYVPLLRRLGDLFDAIGSDENLVEESKVRERFIPQKIRKSKVNSKSCTCARKSEPQTHEKTIASTSTSNTKITHSREDPLEASATTTHHTALSDVSRVGQNQKLSVLPPRNTASSRRNNHGVSQGSSPSLHRSTARHHTRDHGNSEHNTVSERHQACTTYNEENPSGTTRNSSSCDELDRRFRRGEHDAGTINRIGNFTSEGLKGETASQESGGPSNGSEVSNPIKVNRNETEYSEPFRGRRESVPGHQISNITKRIQSREDYETSVFNVTRHFPSHQRIAEGNGESAEQNQKDDTALKTVIKVKDLSKFGKYPPNANVVMIFDGYSVTRGKYGENTMTEKAIHIHSPQVA